MGSYHNIPSAMTDVSNLTGQKVLKNGFCSLGQTDGVVPLAHAYMQRWNHFKISMHMPLSPLTKHGQTQYESVTVPSQIWPYCLPRRSLKL